MRIALTFLILCLSQAFGQRSAPNLNGQVLDPNGAVIGPQSHPHVEIRHNDASLVTGNVPATIEIDTDTAGKYTVELQPGVYDVCVFAERFAPDCTQLEIKNSLPISYSTRLRVSPIFAVESPICHVDADVSVPSIEMPLADHIELKKFPLAASVSKRRQLSR
jgi:hypothetical protein